MDGFRSFFFGVMVTILGIWEVGHAVGQNDSFHNGSRSRDYEAVQGYVNSKRSIPLQEKGCNLSISGDVRFIYAWIDEAINDRHLRGKGHFAKQNEFTGRVEFTETGPPPASGIPFTHNNFDVELNLYFDYICDGAWGVAWLQFDNDGGIFHIGKSEDSDQRLHGSGHCEDLCLKKAYMGYNLCADGCQRIDIELGRRPLYTIFDSRMQFQSNFDGLLLRYGHSLDHWGDFYWNCGAFVVDERADHYAYVTEVGVLNACCCDLDCKYSFIDWKSFMSGNTNRSGMENPEGVFFRVSQFSAAYRFVGDYLCLPIKIYGAFIWNHAAKEVFQTADTRRQYAWYVGCVIGEVCVEGDWALDCSYQHVQSQAISGADFGGSGSKGRNLLDRNLYDSFATNVATARDFTNFFGINIEALYAMTDNLSVHGLFEWSRDDKRQIGGRQDYVKAELAGIYAF